MAFKYAVALTGSIATGKSSVARLLIDMGFCIIDADKIAHKVLNEQKHTIVDMFGKHLLLEDSIDRKALGAIVFKDEQKRKMLEEILHPLIYKHIASSAKTLDESKKIYFVDIPLFFETNRYPIEKVLVVYSPKKIQLKRLATRDKILKIEAQKRIDMQIDIEKKVKNASYVIDNSGTLTQLKEKTLRIVEDIKKDF